MARIAGGEVSLHLSWDPRWLLVSQAWMLALETHITPLGGTLECHCATSTRHPV